VEAYTIHQLSFAYPEADAAALHQVSLSVQEGQWVTICGASGSGKSTLLRHLKTDLTPKGACSGTILWKDMPLHQVERRVQAGAIGYVCQNPEDGIVTDKVWHELAFGLENLGVPPDVIRLRAAELAHCFGMEGWYRKPVWELSGGQKQMLNLAAALMTQPSVLLLDEPTSQLDPVAAGEFLSLLSKVHQEFGTTILLAEHRLEEALPLSDRVIVLEQGQVCADGTPREVGQQLRAQNSGMFYAMPTPMRIYAGVDQPFPCPITVREGQKWLSLVHDRRPLDPVEEPPRKVLEGKPVLSASHLFFRYERTGADVLKDVSLSVYEGECYGILGGNGAGKSTLLSLLCGLQSPQQGKLKVFDAVWKKGKHPEIGLLPQSPQALFSHQTVEEELLEMTEGTKEERRAKAKPLAAQCRIGALLNRHPYDLSGGEQQRVALCKVLLRRPRILLLDEPTKGMDGQMKHHFGGILKELQKTGITIVLVSHDVEFCARYTDRCGLLFDGGMVREGETRAFFQGNRYYTTAANRMARNLLPGAVTAEDVILACGGRCTPPSPPGEGERPSPPPPAPDSCAHSGGHREKGGRAWLYFGLALALMGATIALGIYGWKDRAYGVVSVLLLLEMMAPFFLLLEGRRPQTREIVLLATLCAIGVAGRAVFAAVPQVKPVAALVTLSGVCFGPQTGFLVGAVTTFLSNFLLGQGPWTPWQMAAMGLIGLLAGVLFSGDRQKRRLIPICLYGGLSVFLVYGGLLNPASVLMFQSQPTWEMIALSYLRGIPFDAVHSLSTVLFLLFLTKPMVEKAERLQKNCGVLSF
jgi:energy-coupling factor transporter ATP-binding protein EcfA2/uncharacterized membrane protein